MVKKKKFSIKALLALELGEKNMGRVGVAF